MAIIPKDIHAGNGVPGPLLYTILIQFFQCAFSGLLFATIGAVADSIVHFVCCGYFVI